MFDENEEFNFDQRLSAPEFSSADIDVEYSLRPKTLAEYIGQDKIKKTFLFTLRRQRLGMSPWIMCCCMVLQGWEKLLCLGLLPMR